MVELFIDTGERAFGWATFENGRLLKFGVVHDKVVRVNPMLTRSSEMLKSVDLLGSLLLEHAPLGLQRAYVEWPEFRGSSAKGHAAAARGDLTALAFAAGWFLRTLKEHTRGRCECHVLPVSTWKRSMKKDQVTQRVGLALMHDRVQMPVSHAIDAVGMGLFINNHPLFKMRKKGKGR